MQAAEDYNTCTIHFPLLANAYINFRKKKVRELMKQIPYCLLMLVFFLFTLANNQQFYEALLSDSIHFVSISISATFN